MTDEEKPSILGDPHHNRADARMAARLISLGVVSEEKARAVLGGAFTLAAQAIKDKKARDYSAAMAVPIAAAKLEMERERLDMDASNPTPAAQVNVNVTNNSTTLNLTAMPIEQLENLVASGAVLDPQELAKLPKDVLTRLYTRAIGKPS